MIVKRYHTMKLIKNCYQSNFINVVMDMVINIIFVNAVFQDVCGQSFTSNFLEKKIYMRNIIIWIYVDLNI